MSSRVLRPRPVKKKMTLTLICDAVICGARCSAPIQGAARATQMTTMTFRTKELEE